MRRSILLPTAAVTIAAAAGLATGLDRGDDVAPERQREVAQRGAEVMPFDLERTTHRFEATSYGGRQVVVADDPGDRRQIGLIREHLREEAAAFERGEFDDPAAIHGEEMPGLSTLRQAGDKLSVEVRDRPDGAQLTYRTDDDAIRDALHRWFEAQLGDHGSHAEAS